MRSGIRITQVQDPGPCYAVRHQVFVIEQGVSEGLEFEGEGPHCLHFAAFEGARAIACLRVTPQEDIAKIERVAVLAEARKTGVGAALMRAVMADLARQGFVSAKLGSQITAQGFYEKLGFVAYGPEFLDADMPHIMMKRGLLG